MASEFKLLSVTLRDVFNYRGDNVIDFGTDNGGNIFLFNMKNGHGKTSLFLGVKWGFYGFAPGMQYIKDGESLRGVGFMNRDAAESGDSSFCVKIRFVYDGRLMELRRECTDFQKDATLLTIKIEGRDRIVRGKDAEDMAAQIIPPDYGDFFMFNGEILSDIAENQKDQMKTDGVLKLLGLKQISDLKNHLESVERTLNDSFNNNILSKRGKSEIAMEMEQKNKELSECRSDLNGVNKQLKELDDAIFALEERRRNYSDVESVLNKVRNLQSEKATLEGEIEGLEGNMGKNGVDVFLLFLHDEVSQMSDRLKRERKDLGKDLNSPRAQRDVGRILQEKVVRDHLSECPVCRSSLSEEQIAEIQRVLDSYAERDSGFLEMKGRHEEISDRIEFLDGELDREPRVLSKKCTDLLKRKRRLREVDSELSAMNEILASDSAVDEVKAITSELIQLQNQRPNLAARKKKLERIVKAGEDANKSLQRQLVKESQLDAISQKQNRALEYTRDLIKHVGRVMAALKRQKREDILDKASQVFMGLTNKPDVYRGLAYDNSDSFSMHIVKRDGTRSVSPSAGEKHVLAMSFLMSLCLNTDRLNPIIMDSPLARLDNVHKVNIGRVLSRLENQVIFLAQPGELDDVTLESMRGSVAKYFEAETMDDNTACIVEAEL